MSESLRLLWETALELEQSIDTLPGAEPLDAAEGRRFLLRMLAASVDTFVEHDDVDRPAFHHAESPIRKMFADCPDTDYLRAPLQVGGGRAYRLRGRIPEGTLYVGILLYGKGGRIGNRLTDAELALDAEGRFEVTIACEEQPGTWLKADGDETAVLVRQYFGDREQEAPLEVEIEYLGEPAAPAAVDPERLAARVGKSGRMLRAIFQRTRMAHQMASSVPPNTFLQVPGEQLFPTPDNRYSVAWFRLPEGGSLTMRGRLPEARYVSVTLYNAWLESLDYERHRISLNHRQIVCGPDGSFELTLADGPAAGPNALDTAGHRQGYLLVRCLLLEGEMPEFELVEA
ncbi:MAG: hypothetical protein P1V51_16980 [Deltaproteobacteria bacterium]|nr:hypothetical protein [Deltaproteobacteria bacterium]